jgi:uncharacterized RDD family membrane protein YckC
MKCPKCGYLGFETTERCRHCGYDFSLSITADNDDAEALPLRHASEREAPLADFDLTSLDTATAVATPPPDEIEQLYALEPPPAGAPLAVRRATPEVPRRRTPRMVRRDVEDVGLQLEPIAAPGAQTTYREQQDVSRTASAVRRVTAALVDAVILGGISAAVLYLTLAIAGLSMADWRLVPAVPLAAFLFLINAGYLIVFTATNGQTIGKMVTGIRVISDRGERVDIGGAALRALAALLCVVLAGLPYLPVFVAKDRRALHDRLAGTRVIKHA